MNNTLQGVAAVAVAVLIGVGVAVPWGKIASPDAPDSRQFHADAVPATPGVAHLATLQTEIDMVRLELAELRQNADDASLPANGDQNASHLAQVLATLREDVATLTRDMAALSVDRTNPLPLDSSVMEEREDLEDAEASLEQAELLQLQRMASLGEYLVSEPEDTGWSAAATETIRKAFGSEELASLSVTDVTCRATLCRLEVGADDVRSMVEMEVWLHEKVGSELPRATMHQTEHADGSMTAVVFMAREGHRFPGT